MPGHRRMCPPVRSRTSCITPRPCRSRSASASRIWNQCGCKGGGSGRARGIAPPCIYLRVYTFRYIPLALRRGRGSKGWKTAIYWKGRNKRRSETKRLPERPHAAVHGAIERRRGAGVESRPELDGLPGKDLNAASLGGVPRMADAHDVNTLPQVLRRAPVRIGRESRDHVVLRRQDL